METSLEKFFLAFTQGQTMMEGRTFVKAFKDTKMIDNHLTAIDLDIIFAKVKNKTEKKITLPQFNEAVRLAAEKKKISFDDLAAKLCAASGPKFEGTKADYVKFHDDKSTYTGVHTKGGPSNIDKDKLPDLSKICNREEADVRGINKKI